MSRYNYQRRESSEAEARGVKIGGKNPIRVQSMNNTDTMDTEGSAQQAMRIAKAGGEIVRLTTQGEREARNMEAIGKRLRELGVEVPLVADVHFNPKAAYAAAETCDKVRINPGNFVDAARTFRKLEFTDEEYDRELEKIRKALVPFLDICRKRGVCVRLGVNHGSLSDRIMSRYGDTPEGMVASVMEYLRICREVDFNNIVISIKASNTVVMTRTVRLLAREMEKEDMHYPLHLGVTEAGDGEDGRIKSAVGIGSLLAEGYGDTIRVSLSEPPEMEIPVAVKLRDYIMKRQGHPEIVEPELSFPESRRASFPIEGHEDAVTPLVVGVDITLQETEKMQHIDASQPIEDAKPECNIILTSKHQNPVGEISSWIDRYVLEGGRNPIILALEYDVENEEDLQIYAGADFGSLLLNGYGRGIWIKATDRCKQRIGEEAINRIALGILQATRLRFSKTEYIACPSCGRTLFDLPATLAQVRAATQHLKGLKIGVMGCIVNGPGEMADADYGYVGAGPGKVSIYKGKQLLLKNIDTDKALVELLKVIEKDRQDSISGRQA